jgi:AcrR family transcriptional regulator
MAKPAKPLTRTAWIEAGQQILRESGARALKLHALAKRAGASTGSFYHHFDDFDDFVGALLDYYGGEQWNAHIATIAPAAGGPRARLEAMIELVRAEDLTALAMSMRAWARSDPRADAAVRRLDRLLLEFQVGCFKELGFSERDAWLRAYLFLAAASVEIPLPRKAGVRADTGERILDLLCRR